ncbi:MAG: hypothetical protein GX102_01285 [Porphyromonadaceae bacterium]|nr:hypothetical protein [Porphyromonadaceae bacterium]
MKILKLLYCKYYWFQVKVGNADIAVFSAMILIAIIIIIIALDILMIIGLFDFLIQIPVEIIVVFPVMLIVLLYFLLIHNQKYKRIINNDEFKKDKKGNRIAIVLPLSAFLLFIFATILKILQNNEVI